MATYSRTLSPQADTSCKDDQEPLNVTDASGNNGTLLVPGGIAHYNGFVFLLVTDPDGHTVRQQERVAVWPNFAYNRDNSTAPLPDETSSDKLTRQQAAFQRSWGVRHPTVIAAGPFVYVYALDTWMYCGGYASYYPNEIAGKSSWGLRTLRAIDGGGVGSFPIADDGAR